MVQNIGMGLILEQSGPLSFKIRLHDGLVFRRHQDHLRLCDISDDHTPIGHLSRVNVTIPIATDVPSVQLPKPTTPVQLEGEERNRNCIEPTTNMPAPTVVQVPSVAEKISTIKTLVDPTEKTTGLYEGLSF